MAEASGRKRRWCDRCQARQPASGFRNGWCGDCFRSHLRGLPLDVLVGALHLTFRAPSPGDAYRLRKLLQLPDPAQNA